MIYKVKIEFNKQIQINWVDRQIRRGLFLEIETKLVGTLIEH